MTSMPWPDVAFHREALTFERPWIAGAWGAQAPRAYQQHVHDSLELIWNERPMVLLLAGKRYTLKEPTVVILPPFATHIAEPVDKLERGQVLGCHVGFLEPALQSSPLQTTLRAGALSPEHTAMVLPVLRYLVAKFRESREHNSSKDLRLLAQGVLGLLRELGYAAPVNRQKNFRSVRKALEVLYARYSDPNLSMVSMARASNFSAAQFRRVFRKVMGEAPHAYLVRHRLEQARHLLAHDVLTVAAVARRVGFRSPGSFYKAYQKAYGVSPRTG